jgi:hypothetical protein
MKSRCRSPGAVTVHLLQTMTFNYVKRFHSLPYAVAINLNQAFP